ncbi:hypothetical protein DMA12_15665 [Amycolatopsis balhimycina DSM 5908]|uniref:Uncharacterized protein n=1 Tax=Amycolatopsis balhimycina DSM 5908 TaxID=1081091 RepID=A0A428WNE8_AMYBA|nr:hypothetical protein [Amycolatopsis balhimycina]RSM44606.1 hypothetical protein DMA12_15665 [Amycolatopsis balhimycina DSM 5908]
MAPTTGPRVGILCEQAGEALADRAARYGVADVLARVVAAASRGEVAEADLDLLDSAFARHGIDHLTRGHRSFEPWPGARKLVATGWECPTGACPRVATGEQPSCRLTGRPFRETRVEL